MHQDRAGAVQKCFGALLGLRPVRNSSCLAPGSGCFPTPWHPRGSKQPGAKAMRAEQRGWAAFAGCRLPVLRACVLLVSVKSGKSEQLREAGDCFPLPSAAGRLLCNIGSQALLHHNRRFDIPVLVSSRAGSPSHAVGPLWNLEVKDRQVTSRERGVHPCFSFLKGTEARLSWAR